MDLLVIGLLKLVDSLLTTTKSILVHKNKAVLASIAIFLSQIMFYVVIRQMVSANSIQSILVVAFASAIGTLIAFIFNNRFSKDALFLNFISSNNRNDIAELCDYLKENKIKNIITDCYTKEWDKTLTVQIFANTREQSKLINQFIENHENKFFREILN